MLNFLCNFFAFKNLNSGSFMNVVIFWFTAVWGGSWSWWFLFIFCLYNYYFWLIFWEKSIIFFSLKHRLARVVKVWWLGRLDLRWLQVLFSCLITLISSSVWSIHKIMDTRSWLDSWSTSTDLLIHRWSILLTLTHFQFIRNP